MYIIRELTAGEIFGHEELLLHFDNVLRTNNGKI
jgi:hypothetical protein